jgi:uncharacterized membrane protein YfhO
MYLTIAKRQFLCYKKKLVLMKIIKKTLLSDIICIFTLFFAISIYFYPFFFPEPKILVTPDLGISDSWDDGFSKKYLLWKSLRKFEIPIWTDKLSNGFPLLGEGQAGEFFPLSIIYSIIPSPAVSYNLTLFTDVFLFGLGFYFWLRKIGLKYGPSLFAAISLSLSGVVIPQLVHIMHISGMALIPWVMLSTLLLFLDISLFHLLFLSICFSIQFFSGFPQTIFITGIFSACYLSYLILTNQKKLRKRIIKITIYYFIGLIVVIPLSAVQLLPSYEFLQNSLNPNGFDQSTATAFSFPFAHLLTFLNPFFLGNPQNGTYFINFNNLSSIFWENSGYIGILPLLFIVGLFIKTKTVDHKNIIRFFVIMLGTSFLLMLGKYSPFYLIYSFWPFNLFRVPSRFIWIFVISLLVLSAIGFERIISITPKKIKPYMIGSCIVILFLDLFLNWHSYHALEPETKWLSAPNVFKSLNNQDKILTYNYSTSHNSVFLHHGWKDIEPFYFLRNMLPANSNVMWNLANVSVYSGRFLRRPTYMANLVTSLILANDQIATVSAQTEKMLTINNISTLLSSLLFNNSEYKISNTLKDKKSTIYIYKNNKNIKDVYIADIIFKAATLKEAAMVFATPQFIPEKSVLLETDLAIPQPATGTANIVKKDNTFIEITTSIESEKAILVLNSSYFPGWEARIDNSVTKIYPANIQYQAIIIPRGKHTIIFSYRPLSYRIGSIISLICWLITLALMGYLVFFESRHTPFSRH